MMHRNNFSSKIQLSSCPVFQPIMFSFMGIAGRANPLRSNLYSTNFRIVRSMAQQRQLPIADDVLMPKALLWVQRHNTRCGRTARQFVDYLSGELGTATLQENP